MSKEEKEVAAPKYGINDLAAELGIEPASARVRCRAKGIAKAGKSYGWNTKDELKAVADQVRADPKAEAAEKPKAKPKAKKAAPKPKTK